MCQKSLLVGNSVNVPSLSLITENNRQIARAIMLLAAVFFAWRMAALLWLLAGQDQSPLAKPTPVTPAITQVNIDGSRLASFTVFKAPTPVVSSTLNAPDTSLQLKLDGVFASSLQSQSSAIISEQGQGIGKLYRVGQQVSGGATLSAVYVDRVLLQRNGQDEVLRFVKTNLLEGDMPPTAATNSMITPQVSTKAEQARSLLGTAIERLNADPDVYLNQMGLIASSGQGYEITDNVPSYIRRNVGLKVGDRILRLNGQPLGNVQLDKNLLQQVQQTGHARIELQRGSHHLTIEQNF